VLTKEQRRSESQIKRELAKRNIQTLELWNSSIWRFGPFSRPSEAISDRRRSRNALLRTNIQSCSLQVYSHAKIVDLVSTSPSSNAMRFCILSIWSAGNKETVCVCVTRVEFRSVCKPPIVPQSMPGHAIAPCMIYTDTWDRLLS
jgi:hypothetical protein